MSTTNFTILFTMIASLGMAAHSEWSESNGGDELLTLPVVVREPLPPSSLFHHAVLLSKAPLFPEPGKWMPSNIAGVTLETRYLRAGGFGSLF